MEIWEDSDLHFKRPFSNLSAGAAVNLTAGSNDSSDWGLGLDLGILHYLMFLMIIISDGCGF